MPAPLDLALPSFRKGHTNWNPKARLDDGVLLIKCGGRGQVTAPHTGKKKDDEKAASDAIRTYAKAHGWEEVK